MTEWERTGNTAYRDKILTGMNPSRLCLTASVPAKISWSASIQQRASSQRETLRRERTTSPPSWEARNSCSSSTSHRRRSLEESLGGFLRELWDDDQRGQTAGLRLLSHEGSRARSERHRESSKQSQCSRRPCRSSRSLASMDDGTDTNGASQNSLNAIAVLEFCADKLPTAAPPENRTATDRFARQLTYLR